MIFDFADLGSEPRDLACDVLVIGGGTVGLVMATRLAQRGKRVVVLESGPRQFSDAPEPLNEVVHLAQHYAGATEGRARCLGGTSTKWGGAMLPFDAEDLEIPQELGWDAPWPIEVGALTSYQAELETLFKLPPGPYDGVDPALGADAPAGFATKLAKWPPFKKRNTATLLAAELASPQGPEVWVQATVTEFMVADRRLAGVVALNPQGGRLTVRAQEVVVAAGAIESTRLLLLLDRAQAGRLFAPADVLGRYFTDHLAIYFAEVVPSDLARFNRVIGFRFQGDGMRNLRFEARPELRRQERLPAGYTQINFPTDAPTGFDALKSIYRSLQRGRTPAPADMAFLMRNLPWFSRAIWWRFMRHRLLFPENPVFKVQLVYEQEPVRGNRIRLSETRMDRYGLPLAELDWTIGEADVAHAQALCARFVDSWREAGIGRHVEIRPFDAAEIRHQAKDAEAFYHPCGSTRMGTSPETGVVDGECRTFALPNLSVVSTSVFPSGGSANPTMMLLLAGLRVADRLARA